jgi:hypothetical protein
MFRVQELEGADEARELNGGVHGRLLKKLLRLPRCAADGMTEMEVAGTLEGKVM